MRVDTIRPKNTEIEKYRDNHKNGYLTSNRRKENG
ncbi:hypothetical protein BH18THE2_BH18THE2_27200 [soil metagenome]